MSRFNHDDFQSVCEKIIDVLNNEIPAEDRFSVGIAALEYTKTVLMDVPEAGEELYTEGGGLQ